MFYSQISSSRVDTLISKVLLYIVTFVPPRISLLYGHVNTHVLELANQMTGKDERERAWTGAVSCAQFSNAVPAINPMAYTDICETAGLARSINTQPAVRRNSETNPTSQHNRGMY